MFKQDILSGVYRQCYSRVNFQILTLEKVIIPPSQPPAHRHSSFTWSVKTIRDFFEDYFLTKHGVWQSVWPFCVRITPFFEKKIYMSFILTCMYKLCLLAPNKLAIDKRHTSEHFINTFTEKSMYASEPKTMGICNSNFRREINSSESDNFQLISWVFG